MSKFRRLVLSGYPHHVTQRGVRRQQTFFDDGDYRKYLEIALEQLDRVNLDVWAYCLMPNHVHWIVVPRADDALSNYFAMLHKQYARCTNKRYDWRGHLWQQRFYSVVMDERHTLVALRYVELNPVRAGIVQHAHHWPWSSARANLGLREDPLMNAASARDLVSDWRNYLDQTALDHEFDNIRRLTRTGRPDGNDEFMDSVESLSGRRVRKRKRGPKTKKVTDH